VDLARKAHALDPDNGAVKDTLGWMLHLSGRHEEGAALLAEATAKLPRNAEIWRHWGEALAAEGKGEDAARVLRAALFLAPRSDRAERIRFLLNRISPRIVPPPYR